MVVHSLDSPAFAPPGPGTWLLDDAHLSRPFSRYQAEIHPPNVAQGFREAFRRYGLVLETLDWRMVSGHAYFAAPLVHEDELPVRLAAAERAFATKLWRADVERWEQQVKPASIRAHQALQAVDPESLPHDELVGHLDRCREHHKRMIRQHHQFNCAAFIPVGDLIAHLREWTGHPLSDFLALVRGTAPESTGAFVSLDRLVDALAAHTEGGDLLDDGGDAAAAIQSLRDEPGSVGAAASEYLDIVGYRLLDSFDAGSPFALEVPEVLLAGIRSAFECGAPMSSTASASEVARVRDVVPSSQRELFDELLTEARLTSSLRDERGLYSDVWAGGIARRALLAAGTRLVAAGRLEEPAHLIECGHAEIRTLLAGEDHPSGDDLAERAHVRAATRISDAPRFLGPPPSPPASLDDLPLVVARGMRAIGAAIDALFVGADASSDATIVRGIGVGSGTYTGTARLVIGPEEFGRIERGDVLVTTSTIESFNIVMPLLGALVTDAGGLLSHAAIVCREYAIPAVVGCGDATSLIADGRQVRVDGTTGEVALLA